MQDKPRFIRKNGRIIPIRGGKKKSKEKSGRNKGWDHELARKVINQHGRAPTKGERAGRAIGMGILGGMFGGAASYAAASAVTKGLSKLSKFKGSGGRLAKYKDLAGAIGLAAGGLSGVIRGATSDNKMISDKKFVREYNKGMKKKRK